jgi:hypothetical protein
MSRTSHHFQLPRSSLIFSGLASPPSQDFTYFSKLPIETRLRIWRYGLPGPRILDFLPAQEDVPKRWEFLFAQRHEGAVLLTLLAVNHESRTEALKYYTIIQQPRGYSVAFDPERDTIYKYGFTLGHFRVQFRAFPSCNQDSKTLYGN